MARLLLRVVLALVVVIGTTGQAIADVVAAVPLVASDSAILHTLDKGLVDDQVAGQGDALGVLVLIALAAFVALVVVWNTAL